MIGPSTAIGLRPHHVIVEIPGTSMPDGDGGYIDGAPVALGDGYARIQPATGADMERIAPGTVLSDASYIVTLPWLAGVTTLARIRLDDGRVFAVTGRSNREERDADLVMVCTEMVT